MWPHEATLVYLSHRSYRIDHIAQTRQKVRPHVCPHLESFRVPLGVSGAHAGDLRTAEVLREALAPGELLVTHLHAMQCGVDVIGLVPLHHFQYEIQPLYSYKLHHVTIYSLSSSVKSIIFSVKCPAGAPARPRNRRANPPRYSRIACPAHTRNGQFVVKDRSF